MPAALRNNASSAASPVRWLFPALATLVGFEILGFGGVYSWVWVPATLAALCLAWVYCGWATWRRQPLPWFPLLYPVLGFGGLVLWQWLGRSSAYPGATLTGALQLVGPAILLYLGYCAFRRASNYRRLGLAAWWFCGALALEAIFQHFDAPGWIYGLRDATYATAAGPFYYHNHFAGCMELLIPLAVAGALMPMARKRRDLPPLLLRCLIPLLGLCAIVVANSRGGMASMLVEAGAAVVLFWRSALRRPRLALALVGAVLAFIGLTTWRPVLNRLEALRGAGQISVQDRVRLTDSSLAMWRDYPFAGAGFNTFAALYPRYQKFDTGQQVLAAHDDYAQTLAETGWIGMALVLAFLVLLGRGYVAAPDCGDEVRYVRQACVIAVAGFLFHSSFDFQFHAPGNVLLFFLICAAAVGKPARRSLRAHAARPAAGSLA